tara:strand:+ start:77 stop:385 length:309 start_codon:yes stop_codon:yes gene_type:complete
MKITSFIGVEQMTSRSGNVVPNQTILSDMTGKTFVSYGSKIVYQSKDRASDGLPLEIIVDENYWDYSRTTGKYRNEFMNMGVQDVRNYIKEGRIQVGNLNRE